LVQAFFLNSKANKLGAASEKAKTHDTATTPLIEVNDKHNEEEDDATDVDEGLDMDEVKIFIF
jgi:hypothetical protein